MQKKKQTVTYRPKNTVTLLFVWGICFFFVEFVVIQPFSFLSHIALNVHQLQDVHTIFIKQNFVLVSPLFTNQHVWVNKV